MRVVCLDGTAIECTHFRAIDSGVLLFEGDPADDEDGSTEEATGFVPHGQLVYVLPDDVQPGTASKGQQRQQTPAVGQWVEGTAPPDYPAQQPPRQQSQQPGPYGQPSPGTGPDR